MVDRLEILSRWEAEEERTQRRGHLGRDKGSEGASQEDVSGRRKGKVPEEGAYLGVFEEQQGA